MSVIIYASQNPHLQKCTAFRHDMPSKTYERHSSRASNSTLERTPLSRQMEKYGPSAELAKCTNDLKVLRLRRTPRPAISSVAPFPDSPRPVSDDARQRNALVVSSSSSTVVSAACGGGHAVRLIGTSFTCTDVDLAADASGRMFGSRENCRQNIRKSLWLADKLALAVCYREL
jgi:hypothetical protein